MQGSRVAVVGVGETEYVRATNRSLMALLVEASHKAIADAGLAPSDIDGMVDCGASCHLDDLAFSMGFGDLSFTAASSVVAGTATVGAGLELAQLAIEAGLARHVLVPYGIKCSKPGGPRTMHAGEPLKADLEMPLGYFGQPAYFAVVANRYHHEHGLSEEELAAVSITTRAWAAITPGAQKRDPLDLAGYRKSPMISTPLRAVDCCLMTDGAGAYVVSSVERARDLRQAPIVVAGLGIATNPLPQSMVLTQNPDLKALPGRKSAAKAYAMAGLGPDDLDLAQVYDCFSISMVLQTEMLGLAEPGQGGRFYASGAAAPGGRMPVNTSGGHLSGGYVPGVNLLIEAVRQLRGERGAAQVPCARVAAVAGLGGNSHATALLTRDQ